MAVAKIRGGGHRPKRNHNKFSQRNRPGTPDDQLIKYAIDKPTSREQQSKNIFILFISLSYIFVGGGIFVALEGPAEQRVCDEMRLDLKNRLMNSTHRHNLWNSSQLIIGQEESKQNFRKVWAVGLLDLEDTLVQTCQKALAID